MKNINLEVFREFCQWREELLSIGYLIFFIHPHTASGVCVCVTLKVFCCFFVTTFHNTLVICLYETKCLIAILCEALKNTRIGDFTAQSYVRKTLEPETVSLIGGVSQAMESIYNLDILFWRDRRLKYVLTLQKIKRIETLFTGTHSHFIYLD